MRRRGWGLTVMLMGAVALSACSMLFGPRDVEVSQAQLQQALERRFPLERRYLELLDVTVAVPRVTLRPEVNRLATEFDVRVTDRIFRAQHRGTIAVDSALRYEPSDHSVRISNVRVERFDIDGAPALLRQQLDRVAVMLAEQTLDEQPVYTLRPKDIEAMEGRGYRPGEIRVTTTGLVVTLLPSAR